MIVGMIMISNSRYADEHCSSLGGSLVVPRNEKENLEVVDIAEDYYQVVIMMIKCDDYTIKINIILFDT